MNFHHDAPNGHVPGTCSFSNKLSLVDNESAKHACKSHTVSAENSLYLLISNT